MLWTARSPLRPVWAGLYAAIAHAVALIVAPRRTQASVYLSGSVAFGEPLYGLSDIDLVAVSGDETESRRVRRRYDALCRALPPLRGLVPHFWTYDRPGLARVLRGSYLVNGLGDGRAVFVGPDAIRDDGGLLQRPGIYGAPEWRRLRGRPAVTRPTPQNRLHAAWLELHHRWRYALRACGEEVGVQRAVLAVGLVAEAARVWLWLAHGERCYGKQAALERALELMPAEEKGLRYALETHRAMHRSPTVAVERLLPSFVDLSGLVAGLVDDAAALAGVTEVRLLGDEVGASFPQEVALLDWTALALPRLSGSTGVVEERLVLVHDDPTDPAVLIAAAAPLGIDRVRALRHGALLIAPTFEVWGYGRLRLIQCRASDPVTAALLDGRGHAAFPELPGWSARDCARRAVAEHRAWLLAGGGSGASPHRWIGPRPASISTGTATLGWLLSAARSATFLQSIEEGTPELPLRLSDVPAALGARDPELGADAAEAYQALDQPSPELVAHFRQRVESLPAYASREEVSLIC